MWPHYWGDDPGLSLMLFIPVGLATLIVVVSYVIKLVRGSSGSDRGDRDRGRKVSGRRDGGEGSGRG